MCRSSVIGDGGWAADDSSSDQGEACSRVALRALPALVVGMGLLCSAGVAAAAQEQAHGLRAGALDQSPSVAAGHTRTPVVLADPRHGDTITARGDFRVFLIFAEVDWTLCGLPDGPNGDWAVGQLPTFRDEMFDHTLSGSPTGLYTDFYYQMSFGELRVTADYYPQLFTMGCSPLPTSRQVIDALQARHAPGGPDAGSPITTASVNPATGTNYVLDDFDAWSPAPAYEPKANLADDQVDMVLVVWRNFCEFLREQCTGPAGSIGGGYTIDLGPGPTPDKTGVQVVGNFAGGNLISLLQILTHEFNHPLMGGNQFHVGGNNGRYNMPFYQSAIGMLGGSPSASGWDRHQLGWLAPGESDSIGAIDPGGARVTSDMSIVSHPNGATFELRDYMTTGDAIRIKLPHIEWQTFGDVKNQYLWVENHQQLKRRFDGTPIPDDRFLDINQPLDRNTCFERWQRGLLAYVQIGKEKELDVDGDGFIDANDIRGSFAPAGQRPDPNPNFLASYLVPLRAEGRFDLYYQLDQVLAPAPGACHWNNWVVPINKANNLANPFTGFSDVYWALDTDNVMALPPASFVPLGDGAIFGGAELPQRPINADFIINQVVLNIPAFGDSEDTFNLASGRSRLALDTNPAPVPLYTMLAQTDTRARLQTNTVFDPRAPASFESRVVRLNGLSVEILEEIPEDTAYDRLVVQVRWDDYRLRSDVRWAGELELINDPMDPLTRQSRIILESGRNLYLDRGLSPTHHVADTATETIEFPPAGNSIYPAGLPSESSRLFTLPTTLTIRAGTKVHLERDATIWLHNGSTLRVEAGAQVQLEPGASILSGPGAGVLDAAPGSVRDFGDLDADGCVDRSDLIALIEGFRQPPPHDPFHDLNEDNVVNVGDARTLVNFFSNPFGAPCL